MVDSMADPVLLPSFIEFRISLWKFEKGGELQGLLHKLKYGSLYGLGNEIGMELGYRMKRLLYGEGYGRHDGLLVPVPLHPRQVRSRGGNQARAIAEGVSAVTGWETVPERFVRRNRDTRSQTGLHREERLENVSGIFDVDLRGVEAAEKRGMAGKGVAAGDGRETGRSVEASGVGTGDTGPGQADRAPQGRIGGLGEQAGGPALWVVIDDVFTTGATTFELAKTLREGGAGHIGIATAATA